MDCSFEDELTCPICYVQYEEKIPPIIICDNSHLVCDGCLWKIYIDPGIKLLCPLCKEEIKHRNVSKTHLEKADELRKREALKKQEEAAKSAKKEEVKPEFDEKKEMLALSKEFEEKARITPQKKPQPNSASSQSPLPKVSFVPPYSRVVTLPQGAADSRK